MKISAFMFLLLFTFALSSCKKEQDAGEEKKSGGEKALVAETEMEKAWLAWKEAACKCTDLACASAQADARMKLEKQYPDSMSPKQKNVGNIVRAANKCLQKATGQ